MGVDSLARRLAGAALQKSEGAATKDYVDNSIIDAINQTGLSDIFTNSKNLFDCNDESAVFHGYIISSINLHESQRTAVVKCKKNTTYVVSIDENLRPRSNIASTDAFPEAGGVATKLIPTKSVYNQKNNRRYYTVTTPADAEYLTFYYYKSGVLDVTEEECRRSIMITEGPELYDFIPYRILSVNDYSLSETMQGLPQRVTDAEAEINKLLPVSDQYSTRSRIYGVRFRREEATSQCERIADAVGLKFNYCIGNSMVYSYENDFDRIFPWCDIRLCNLTENGNIVYEGEEGFVRDGSNGGVFAELPKFYARRTVWNDYEELCISGVKHSGFQVEPCFTDAEGNELDCIYCGVYNSGEDGLPVSGAIPRTNQTMSDNRTMASGLGYTLYDFATLSALQHLILVEYADRDLSKYFNGIGGLPYYSDVKISETATDTNTVRATGMNTSRTSYRNFRVGQTCSVSVDGSFVIEDRKVLAVTFGDDYADVTFDGSPVSVTANVSRIYCTGQPCGSTDILEYHTGRASEENELCAFRWRGIENIWGNVWEQTDGCVVKDLEYYVTTNPEKYVTSDLSGWTKLSYKSVEQNQYPGAETGYIKTQGYDRRNSLFALPDSIENSPVRYGDKLYTIKNVNADGVTYPDGTKFGMVSGGGWDHHLKNGPFTVRFWQGYNGVSGQLNGMRIVARKKI